MVAAPRPQPGRHDHYAHNLEGVLLDRRTHTDPSFLHNLARNEPSATALWKVEAQHQRLRVDSMACMLREGERWNPRGGKRRI